MKREISNKKILITGGAGFIGSNLTESFLNAGNTVVCLDNFSTGKRENLKGFIGNPKYILIEGDIRNPNDCENAVSGIDIVLHQAALGSVPRSIADPVSTTDVNIGGFVKILYASKQAGIKRFVYAASSSTYGDSKILPKVEENIGMRAGKYDKRILKINAIHGPERAGDIPHSQASLEKATRLLGYLPTHSVEMGLEEAVVWYWNNL
jgi:UDP-N-acetylglucosamine 4-epimerase